MSFEHTIQTRYSETAQDGIIHHPSYLVYLEVARIEFFKSMGLVINEMEKKGIFCPVVDLSLKYLKPLYSLEGISVEVSVASFSKVRFVLNYRILRKGVCVTTGTTSHCFANASLKPIRIPKEILEHFEHV
jgi:acyl-CoA thioester hydrolase